MTSEVANMELTNSDDTPLENWDPEQQLSQWLGDIYLMKSYAISEGMPIPATICSFRLLAPSHGSFR